MGEILLLLGDLWTTTENSTNNQATLNWCFILGMRTGWHQRQGRVDQPVSQVMMPLANCHQF